MAGSIFDAIQQGLRAGRRISRRSNRNYGRQVARRYAAAPRRVVHTRRRVARSLGRRVGLQARRATRPAVSAGRRARIRRIRQQQIASVRAQQATSLARFAFSPIDRAHGVGPRLVSGVDYLDPRRAQRQIVREERAFSRSESTYDPKTRALYRAPSQDRIEAAYRKIDSRSSAAQERGLRELDRMRVIPQGRVAIPASALRKEREQAGVDVGSRRNVYRYGKWRYVKQGNRYVPIPTRTVTGSDIMHSLQRAGETAAGWIGNRPVPSQGGSRSKVGPFATVSTVPVGGRAKAVRAAETFGGRLLADLVTIPANVVPSTYYMASELSKGHVGKLIREAKQTDPLALALQGRFGEALKHPGVLGLELLGAKGTTGRLAGRAARSRLAPEAARGYASIVGPRRVLPGTNLALERHYSKDLFKNRREKARDAGRRQKRDSQVRLGQAAERRGDLDVAREHYEKAAKVNPDRLPEEAIQRRVDIREGLVQSRRRPNRAATAKEAKAALGDPKGKHVISLIAQSIVRADKADLHAFSSELRQEASRLPPRKRYANFRMRREIQKVLDDGDVNMAELEAAARRYAEVSRPLEQEAVGAGLLHPDEAEQARLIPYAARKMKARRLEGGGFVRERSFEQAQAIQKELRKARRDLALGKGSHEAVQVLQAQLGRLTIKSSEIRAHMREHGHDPELTSFVTQAPRGLGAGAFNVGWRKRPGFSTRARTGLAVREGTFDPHVDRLVEQAVRSRGMVDADREFKGLIGEIGFREDNGKVFARADKPAAQSLAEDLNSVPGGQQWRVVRLNPWLGRESQLKALLDEADEQGFVAGERRVQHPVSEAMESAMKGEGTEGPWGLVPEAAAERLEQHARVYRDVSPTWRAISQAFRRTVLPFSLPWMTGNLVEGALRAAIKGAGPRSWLDFRRAYNELAIGDSSVRQALRRLPSARPGSAEEQLLHMIPGGHFGGTHDTMIHLSANQFDGKRLRPVAEAFSALYRSPGPGTLARAVSRYTDWVFGTMIAGVESQFTRALAGRYMRDLKPPNATIGRAIRDGSLGLRETPAQVAMGEWVRRAYGAYDSFSPQMRKWVIGYTPFAAWSINAVKFMTSVLPKDHPTLTGLIAAQHNLSEEWRQEHGQGAPWVDSAIPDFLQGSIPLPGGGRLRASRFTPFGFWASPTETVASNVLPMFAGSLMAFRGLDWKGDKLHGGGGRSLSWPERLLIGTREFAYGNVPIIGVAARTIQKGGKPWEGFLEVENPFRVTKRKGEGDTKLDRIYQRIEQRSGGSSDKLDAIYEKIDKKLSAAGR